MINKNSQYFRQAELVVRILPWVAKHDCFALKGGTAINLFVQDMPRLSVDIDLTYLPVRDRDASLKDIEQALRSIAHDIKKQVPGSSVKEIPTGNPKMISKLHVFRNDIQIKIEPNLVIRGTAFPCRDLELSAKAQTAFEMSVNIKVVSVADLYGGKICAALDRQHPRDLFDIKMLLEGIGITSEVKKGFLVYLISHDRPMHELLHPNLKDIRQEYETDFYGMTDDRFSLADLVEARGNLIESIARGLSDTDKEFLISFKRGEPQWRLLGLDGVERLPAVRWKLANIQKMDSEKRRVFVEKLKASFES
ncbi:MAG: nucleotidyl transferase AbiEii/AbiGii toxin family protein [Candidatus Omnitrophota bacterium]